MQSTNLLSDLPSPLTKEFMQDIVCGKQFRFERIITPPHSQISESWYDQLQHEVVVLFSGSATLEFADGELLQLMPGDYVTIPAHTKHRVVKTDSQQNTVWLAIYYED